MKKFIYSTLIMFSLSNGIIAHNDQQSLPAVVSDDAEWMFDEEPDILDAVTTNDCACSPVKVAGDEKTTLLQSYYQTAVLYLLSSYFSLKHSYATAKQYMANMLTWAPKTLSASSSPSLHE